MKKVLSIISAGLLVLMAASCVKEDRIVFDPSNATAPVLNSYEVGESEIIANYTPGVFKQGFNTKIAPNHALALVSIDGKTISKTLTTADKDGVLTLKNANLAKALISLGKAEGSTADISLAVRATMQDPSKDNGLNGFVDSQGTITISSFEVVIPEVVGSPYADYTEVSDWSVIGALSAYELDWNGDLNMWTDGEGNHVAAHVAIKQGEHFKFRKNQDWGVNLGGDFASLDDEFSVTQDGPDISVSADGVYDLFVNPDAGIAWISAAYDPYPDYTEASAWSVIGSLPAQGINWDGDIAMVSDGSNHVAFGVSVGAADAFKFRKDKDWGVNLGGEFAALGDDFSVTQDGPDIKVGVDGVFDLFVNPDAGTARVAEASGMKVSSVIGAGGDDQEPEPAYVGWGIIGDFNNWNADAPMTEKDGVWTGYFTNVAKEDGSVGGFKFRKDADWAENYGAAGETEPFEVTLGEPIEAVAGGKNLGTPAGYYKAVLDLSDESNPTITISEATVYSLIGEINGDSWKKDVEMTFKDGVWTSPVVTISGGFKIRHNYSWADDDTYGMAEGESAEVGKEITLVQPGVNISLEAGDYKVQFNPESKKMLISAVAFPEHLYMIGDEFGGWDWGSDGVVEMTPVLHNPDWGAEAEAQFYTVRYFSAGKGFKFNSKKDWGGDFWGLTNNDGFTESGGNCVVAEDGFYLVHIDLKNEKVHVEPARVYGIGDAFGSWDEEKEDNLFKAEGKTLTAATAKAGKLRMYVASTIATSSWWTREFNIIGDAVVPRIMDELDAPEVMGGQVIALNFNEGTGSITGEGEGPAYQAELSVPGNWSVWTADAPKLSGNQQGQYLGALVMGGESVEFKFIHDGSWIGGTAGETALAYTLGADSNMTIAPGTYWWNVDLEAKTAQATPITKVGIIGSFNEWAADVEMTAGQDDAFSATVTLEANAKFKIRFNGNWDLALGGSTDALSAYGGDIEVAEAGTYLVTVFLNHRTISLNPAN